MLVSALALLLAAEATTTATMTVVDEPDPKAMTQSEIRAFNAKLTRDHPFYIRCVRSADTGSLIARKASCRTNQQWERSQENGNREAREIQDAMSSKSWNTSN